MTDVTVFVSISVTDLEPMMNMEDLFQKLGRCRFFSKIDLSKRYWQIPVAEEDVHKTAFVTGNKCYEFLRIPFDSKNSEATWVRGISFFRISTMPRAIMMSRSFIRRTEILLLQVLDELLRRLQKAHLAVWPTKSLFGSKSIEFWAHLVGGDCITILEKTWKRFAKSSVPPRKRKYDRSWAC